MDRVAFIIGEKLVYWNSIVLTLAAAVAILFFLSFYIGKCGGSKPPPYGFRYYMRMEVIEFSSM